MTVIYSAKVATANFSCFFKLLMRWRGSIYKILWKEFAIFSLAYFSLSFFYKYILTETQKRYFELGAQYCSQFNNLIPVAFVLGFYVNHVASRWWEKFRTLPWPGRMAMYVTAHLHGHDERARLMRRTIMRYMCLSYVMTMSSISPPVKKRFPNYTKMLEAGLMLPNEEKVINNIKTSYNKFFIPLVWATAVVTRARKEGRIKDDFAVKTLIDEINDYRTRSFQLFNFDWVTIPLVYTQVVTLAVYTFFLSCLMGRQHLNNGQSGDMIFPLFTFLQFLFYMGWLKVAETMLNPFGEDDDDFDINYLIDRHLKVSYLVVDEMHNEHPDLIRDQYWDSIDFQLPYNDESQPPTNDLLQGSAIDINVPDKKTVLVSSSLPRIDEESGTTSLFSPLHTKKLIRTFSGTSNSSRTKHKPFNFFKNMKRNESKESISMENISNSFNSSGFVAGASVTTRSIDINKPVVQEEGIFSMSFEDEDVDLSSRIKNVKQKSVYFEQESTKGSPKNVERKKSYMKRNSTDGDLELDRRSKDGHKNRFSLASRHRNNSITYSIAEEEEALTPIDEANNSGEKVIFVGELMQNLRSMHQNETTSQQASYTSQAEIMSLLKNNFKPSPH